MIGLVHTDPDLSQMFGRLADHRGLDGMPALLIEGLPGSGKGHYLHHLVRQLCCSHGYRPFSTEPAPSQSCRCPTCLRLDDGEVPDYVVLRGREGIAELRDSLSYATSHQPTQLGRRVLLLRRIDRYSAAALDTLLEVVEQPPDHLLVLATARSSTVLPTTLSGRFHPLRHQSPTPEQVRDVVAGDPALRQASASAGDYLFRSVGQLVAAVAHRFELRFEQFCLSSDFVGLEKRVFDFLREVAADANQNESDTLEFFVEWLFWRLSTYCEAQAAQKPAYRTVLVRLPGLLRSSQATVGRFGHKPNPRAFITPSAQFYSLISSLYMLRRCAGLS